MNVKTDFKCTLKAKPTSGLENNCGRASDTFVRCAIERLGKRRLQFVNLRGLQMAHEAEYVDFIHHPGPLSNGIVQHFLALLGT